VGAVRVEITEAHQARAAEAFISKEGHGGFGAIYAWRHICRIVKAGGGYCVATGFTEKYEDAPEVWCIHAFEITSDPAKWPRVPSIAHVVAFAESNPGVFNG
jgi:hypothetical protein